MKQGRIYLCAVASLFTWFSEAEAGVAHFAAGHAHSAAVKTDGTLWTWGGTPTKVGDAEWKTVSAGNGHTVAIKKDGTLWAWGDNGDGQLGDGTTDDKESPVQVCTQKPSCSPAPCTPPPCTETWTAVAAGGGYSHKIESAYTVAVKSDGTLWMWGGQSKRREEDICIANPMQVEVDTEKKWQAVAVGNGHFAAIQTDGTLWTWGENWDGQLGDGTEEKKDVPAQIGTAKWKAVSAGFFHTVAIREDGTLWAWGDDESGQLGDDELLEDKSVPVQVGNDADWKAIGAGADYTVAVKADGSLWRWGYLGFFGDALVSTPKRFGTENGWQDVAAGGFHVLSAKKDGSFWGFGANNAGQLREILPMYATAPKQIGSASDWQTVIPGRYHTLALNTDGALWAWGINASGELGNGSRQYVGSSIQIGTESWLPGDAGRDYSLMIKKDGTLWGWGSSLFGQLGNGGIVKGDPPTQVGTETWQSVSAGEFHTLAIKADGTSWAWGYNENGQLGLGDAMTDDQHEPQQVSAESWRAVAAGDFHSVAIKADGTLWAWGSNGCGQLGTGADSRVPVQVCTETPCDKDWQAVAAGRWHTLALKTDGTLWGWGRNSSGQIGNGKFGVDDKMIEWNPVRISTDWKAVTAGGSHSCALKADGTLWAWGENSAGQLGDGTTEDKCAPSQIGTGIWRQVAAGRNHTFAISQDGTLWAWGWTAEGQDGNGLALEVNPVLIFGADAGFLPAVYNLLLKR